MEFSDVEPDDTCACGGCANRRRARLHAARVEHGGHPAARGARRAAVLVAAVGSMLGGGGAAAIATAVPRTDAGPQIPDSPQGEVSGLHGGSAAQPFAKAAEQPATTRAEIMQRAQHWVDQKVPYSMSRYWSDGYRQDCSGFVSMAWGLGSSQTTWTLPDFAERITRNDLQPGDALVYNNPGDPEGGSHVVLFGGWTDATHTRYTALEQTLPGTTERSTPYAYWSHADAYVPYRYKGLNAPQPLPDAFPGADAFGPGKVNAYVTRLGRMLVDRGASRYYHEGPSADWGEADRKATEAFQLAQGWRGGEADGYPGKDTWDLLVNHKGKDIPPGAVQPPPPGPTTTPPPAGVPPFPGADRFGPGQVNDYVTQLGRQLVKKGYGASYREGPSPDWGEADRKATEAFQRAQGWTGAEADGYPGKDTWRLLFS
ncbi:peptidoglycan-binding protein [Kitasatospora sp. NPDC049285]|uniref:peptidoglycan-binding protein n=1 Tax=Kitasatospora sp. NPDC049285 TaxID=3157096 RepID=UPI00342312FF